MLHYFYHKLGTGATTNMERMSADKYCKKVTTETMVCSSFFYLFYVQQKCGKIHPSVKLLRIPNEGERTYGLVQMLKNEGWGAGYPDYLILLEGSRFMAIEFKRPGGGVLSAEQKAFRDHCNKHNMLHMVTDKEWDAIDFIKKHMSIDISSK